MGLQNVLYAYLQKPDQGIGLKLDKLFEGTGQGLTFDGCTVGIDTSNNNTGFFALIDSSATNTETLFNSADSPSAQGSMVLENVKVDVTVGSVSIYECSTNMSTRTDELTHTTQTVTAGGTKVLSGSVGPGQTWIWGNVYTPDSSPLGSHAEGKLFPSSRSAKLIDGAGNFFTVKPPTYQEFYVSEVVNVKSQASCGFPVAGDGVTDE